MPTEAPIQSKGIIFPESKLAHELLDGLEGLELGPAAHNPFGLRTRNVALTAEMDAHDYGDSANQQLAMCGEVAPIHIPADAAAIPVPESSVDFVLHSHVWEHMPNPLMALEEWVRVVRPGGFIFAIVPKRDAAVADQTRPLTTIAELIEHHGRRTRYEDRMWEMNGIPRGHYSVFSPGLLDEIEGWFNRAHPSTQLERVAYQETDDKVGNGHTIVWRVQKRMETTSTAPDLTAEFDRLGPWVFQFRINGEDYGGTVAADGDERLAQFFEFAPKPGRVLELGSLEGAQTVLLASRASEVVAIEGRQVNIRKAELIKRVLHLDNVSFMQANLESADLTQFGNFDTVFCSGLLYHLPEPWRFLEHVSRLAPRLFIWTHYADDAHADELRGDLRGQVKVEGGAADPLSGMSETAFWLTLGSLIKVLTRSGYDSVRIIKDDLAHSNGPAVTLSAQRD